LERMRLGPGLAAESESDSRPAEPRAIPRNMLLVQLLADATSLDFGTSGRFLDSFAL
jgi:hypothetical protein